MDKTDVAGLKIDSLSKKQLRNEVLARIKSSQKTWITTVYSEFLYAALRDPKIMDLLNQADIAVPDGVGIFWAKKYLEIPLTAKSYYGKILQAFWQMKYSLAAIIFKRSWIRSAFPEKIVGADLIWDVAEMAAKNNLSVYILGGFGETPKIVANQLISRSANQLEISGYSNKNPNDPTIIQDMLNAKPDILMVAFGPIKQEAWMAANMHNLPAKLYIGLGGTFDYMAGKRLQPPQFLRSVGLEWLWRLFTQPKRIKRIFNATFGLAISLLRYKLFETAPFRPNVAVVILNKENKI